MTIDAIKDNILQNFQGTHFVESDGNIFFSYADNNNFPFVTIVSSDNDFDNVSKLNREGFFRLNISIDKKSFKEIFIGKEHYKGIGGYLNSDIDFTVENTIFPHPIYGFMYWISVINPSYETYTLLEPYLTITYNKLAGK